MKGKLKALIISVAALALSVPCALTPVFANSGPTHEEGVSSSGLVVRGEGSVLAVESEKLTFDITSDPDYYSSAPKAYVTAEYKFVNTSAEAVRTSMAFPVGGYDNYYSEEEREEYEKKPQITVDGEEAEFETRVTYGLYEDFQKEVKRLNAGYFTDGFFSPGLKVTVYKATVDLSAAKGHSTVYLVGEAECREGTRYISGGYGDLYFSFDVSGDSDAGKTEYSAQAVAAPADKYKNGYVFVLGDEDGFTCKWKTEYHEYRYGTIGVQDADVPYEVTKVEETTFKDLILGTREEGSEVSDLDYYNFVCEKLGTNDCAGFYSELRIDAYDRRTVWYTYDVEVAAGASIINKVYSPLNFSYIDYTYSPSVFSYEYYLSPAASWASFGKLEVTINTDMHLIDKPDAFEKADGGYAASFSSLPDGELKFKLCASENPKARGREAAIILSVFIIAVIAVPLAGCTTGVVLLTVYLVKDKKRSRENGN